jgi:hypothetical protein
MGRDYGIGEGQDSVFAVVEEPLEGDEVEIVQPEHPFVFC